jgi:hypothetical protein
MRILELIRRQTDAERKFLLHHQHPPFEPRPEHEKNRCRHGRFVDESAADPDSEIQGLPFHGHEDSGLWAKMIQPRRVWNQTPDCSEPVSAPPLNSRAACSQSDFETCTGVRPLLTASSYARRRPASHVTTPARAEPMVKEVSSDGIVFISWKLPCVRKCLRVSRHFNPAFAPIFTRIS